MRISEAANMTGLSVSNIRFYEKKGLLAPARETESKYRDYSEQDIEELKRIILYRKMNLPIETIYLLETGEVSVRSVLKRQEEELRVQQEMLQGAIDLCQKLLETEDLENLDVDYYLNYVKEEEKNGKHFAEAEELLEDFIEFSGLTSFQWDLRLGWFQKVLQNRRGMRMIASICFLICLLTPILMIIRNISQGGEMQIWGVGFWILWFCSFLYAFFRFRKGKR